MFPKHNMSIRELHNASILAPMFEPGKNEKVMGHFLFARLSSICDTATTDPSLSKWILQFYDSIGDVAFSLSSFLFYFIHNCFVLIDTDQEKARRIAELFDLAALLILGQGSNGFKDFEKTNQFENAFKFFKLREGRTTEANIMPSDAQHSLYCQPITVLRVLMSMLDIELDTNVNLLEARGKPLMGEYGFVFKQILTRPEFKALRFNVAESDLKLCSVICTDLPDVPSGAEFCEFKARVAFEIDDSDDEVSGSKYCITILTAFGVYSVSSCNTNSKPEELRSSHSLTRR
jgi:hypothetical protein